MNKKLALIATACLIALFLSNVIVAYGAAMHDCIVYLEQSSGITATLTGYLTKDGVKVSNNFTLTCTGNVASKSFAASDLAENPNDFHFNLTVTWSAGPMNYKNQEFSWTGSLGTKKYVNGSGTVEIKIASSVGGVVVPLDKLAALAPYIGLGTVVAIGAIVGTVKYKRRK